MARIMYRKRIAIGSIIGSVIIVGGIVGGIIYTKKQEALSAEKKAFEMQSQYNSIMTKAEKDITASNLSSALLLVKQALQLERTSKAVALANVLEKAEAHQLKIDDSEAEVVNPAYSFNVGGSQPVKGAYVVVALSVNTNTLSQQNAGVTDTADYRSILDSLPIGQQMFVEVVDPNNKEQVFRAVIEGADGSSIGMKDVYTNGRYGVNVTLPKLVIDGVSFGWIPQTGPADGDGRKFIDPLEPDVTITAFGSNNAMNNPLTSVIPLSAQILNSNLTVGNYPAIEFKELKSTNGVDTVTEGIAAGSSTLPSMNEIEVTVPSSELSKWHPIINQALDSFFPGDLTQAH